MKVALEVWSPDFDRVEATCRLADSLGIHAFYYGESPHELNLDCWSTLAALARSTERIRLGPVITNILPGYRSTMLLAKQTATVDAISAGRVDFRTGPEPLPRSGDRGGNRSAFAIRTIRNDWPTSNARSPSSHLCGRAVDHR